MQVNIVEHYAMLKGIPEEDLPKDMAEFWNSVAYEMANLMNYAKDAKGEAQIVFHPYRKAGEQYIWEFFVNDLAIPSGDKHNWHGQNTSQWLYAGGMVLQNGRVSLHH